MVTLIRIRTIRKSWLYAVMISGLITSSYLWKLHRSSQLAIKKDISEIFDSMNTGISTPSPTLQRHESTDGVAAMVAVSSPTIISDNVNLERDSTLVESERMSRLRENVDDCAQSDTQGFLLGVYFNQQAMGSFIAFSQLSKIASLLNLSTVEPYVYGTELRGVPRLQGANTLQETLKLSTLYDFESLQSTLQLCCFAKKFVTIKPLTRRAHHNVIYVSFVYYKLNNRVVPPEKVMEVDPSNMATGEMQYYDDVKEWISHISNNNTSLELSRTVLVESVPYNPVYLADITKVLGPIVREEVAKHGSVTVIVGRWRGLRNINDSHYFYYIPDFQHYCNVYAVDHSKTVIQAVKEFSQTMSQRRPVIGVHIRGERVLMDYKGEYKPCLEQLVSLLQELSNSNKTLHGSTKIVHDLGKYGTKSCNQDYYCITKQYELVSDIRILGYPIVTFDPTRFKRYPTTHSFVAAVEQEYLSRVDILVTVGHGDYQQSIVDRFLKYSDEKQLHRICKFT